MIYESIKKKSAQGKQVSVLIDPDRINPVKIKYLCGIAEIGLIDFFLWVEV